MALDTIEIRLLQVFDAVYKMRSVTEAAVALDLSQPAVSVALSKLRQHFGDPLFVRTSGGMDPTPFGDSLVRPVRDVLEAGLDCFESEVPPAAVGAARPGFWARVSVAVHRKARPARIRD